MIHPRLMLAILAAQLFGGGALAGDFGASTLAVGEVRTIHTGVVYREIRICNNVGSAGDLVTVIGGNDPIRLAPGMCERNRGDRFELRNVSTGPIASSYKVSICSDMR